MTLICLRCRTRITRSWVMSWWACSCRVWATDEQHARGVQ